MVLAGGSLGQPTLHLFMFSQGESGESDETTFSTTMILRAVCYRQG